MNITLADKMEAVSAKVLANQINIALKMTGLTALHYKRIPVTEDSVYGMYSGGLNISPDSIYSAFDVLDKEPPSAVKTSDTPSQEIAVLITSYQWRVISQSAGYLEDPGHIYSSSPDLLEYNDLISVVRADGTSFRFRVVNPEVIGRTTNILTRFRIAAVGD